MCCTVDELNDFEITSFVLFFLDTCRNLGRVNHNTFFPPLFTYILFWGIFFAKKVAMFMHKSCLKF